MDQFQIIESRINALKELADEKQMDALNKLHQDYISLLNSDNDREHISFLLKEENDCAEVFDADGLEFSEVREIQDAIICLLAND